MVRAATSGSYDVATGPAHVASSRDTNFVVGQLRAELVEAAATPAFYRESFYAVWMAARLFRDGRGAVVGATADN